MRVTRGSENVFLDLGFPAAQAENLRIRSKLMMALTAYIEEKGLDQTEAARTLGVSQPRISGLVRGKIGLFTIDALVKMLVSAGLKVDLSIKPGRVGPKNKRVA
jgi:predicted XRE-type DNA-binding protein